MPSSRWITSAGWGRRWDTSTAPDGSHELVAVARDAAGNRAESLPVPVTVDNMPPDLRLAAQASSLWPRDDLLVPVAVEVTVTDARDAHPTVQLLSITCEQARTAREGNTRVSRPCTSPDDIVGATPGIDDREFQLRAVRLGPRAIRVYTITYSASDEAGNLTNASTSVVVKLPGS